MRGVSAIRSVEAIGLIYRLGRHPDAWQPPDWSFAGEDGTFGNRFDDPAGHYRILYASSQRIGCFLETLARFRVDPNLEAELNAIKGENDFTPLGQVPLAWLSKRTLGSTNASGKFADICSSEWLNFLRRELSSFCNSRDFDATVLQQAENRNVTQRASRIVFETSRYAGIRYLSRHGHDIENWALFEPFQITGSASHNIEANDTDLQQALSTFELVLG